jgi:GDP-L-fucose synthase
MEKNQKIFIAGHRGMVGSAVLRLLEQEGYGQLITAGHSDVDLREQATVRAFFERNRPEVVIMAAARVGGINANRLEKADFLYDNLAIQNNLFQCSLKYGVRRVVFLGSSCIYPAQCPQPIREDYLLTGPLEPTNEGYAVAKIAGLKMARYFHDQYGLSAMCLMPCNLYGTNDHFDLERSHVLSALVRRFTDAVDEEKPSVTLWGTGVAKREFLHVDDVARAILFLDSRVSDPDIINIGTGEEITIFDLAHLIAKHVGFTGEIVWDSSKPDGMLRKVMDVTRMKSAGFHPAISLDQGIAKTVAEYQVIKAAGPVTR